MGRSRALAIALLFLSFVLVSLVQSWPLARSVSSTVTGHPGGDTGVYIWNPWVFRHELLQGHTPLVTDRIFAPGAPANLSLHNYTVAADLVALPLLSFFDVITAFNLVYLLNVALTGIGGYVLARRWHRSGPVSPSDAWLAGLLFACSPFLVARSTAHFSLAAAAALPFFVVALDRTWRAGRLSDAVWTGAAVAWAAYSDPYYGVYCVLIGLAIAAGNLATFHVAPRRGPRSRVLGMLDATLAAAVIVVMSLAMVPGNRLQIASLDISIRSLYTPVLVVTVLAVLRLWLTWKPGVAITAALPQHWLRNGLTAVAVAAALLSPMLAALAARLFDTGLEHAPVLWRSSAPGVDLASFLLPNPNNVLAPRALVEWVSREPGHFEENVVSIPWTALLTILAARVVTGRWSNRFWLALTLGAAWLTLGPFVRVAGIETYVPTPWTLLRYLPLVGEARMPARFGVVVALGVAVLFASALAALKERYPHRRRLLTIGLGLALALELLPAPRTLYDLRLPSIYTTIARDTRNVTVMDLPTGLLDGLVSLGDYTALSQVYQTFHGKRLVGGYLSRVPQQVKDAYMNDAVLGALVDASEGRDPGADRRRAAYAAGPAFADRTNLGYVVIDDGRTTAALRELAIGALRLREIERDGPLGLFVPDPGIN